jgi:hypothetical protein
MDNSKLKSQSYQNDVNGKSLFPTQNVELLVAGFGIQNFKNKFNMENKNQKNGNRLLSNVVRQCKDVPDKPILVFLYKRMKDDKTWCCWYDGFENSIGQAMPHNTPEKIRIQKMAKLIKRGLVSGCGCGCRGDYEITKKGIEWLSLQ